METTYKLYNGITSYVHFLSNALGDSKASKDRITKEDNIKLAKLALIQNYFLLTKKEVVNRKGTLAYSSKVIDEYLEELIGLILPTSKDGIILDGEVIKKPFVVMLIRNRFANGEYTVDLKNDNVILNIDSSRIIIPIQKLNTLFAGISNALVKSKKRNYVDRIIIQNDISGSNMIRTKEELKKELEKTVMRKYSLVSKNNKNIDEDTLKEFNKLIGVISEYLKMGVSFDDILESYEKSISKKGLKLTCDKVKLSDKEISLIIDILSKNKTFFGAKDYHIQKKKINEIMVALKSPEYNSEGLIVGTAKNLLILNGKENLDKISGDEYLAAIISEFLTIYKPLLDNSSKEFSFSKLNLSDFNTVIGENYNTLLKSANDEYISYKTGLNESLRELKIYQEEYYSATSKEEREYMLMKLKLKEREIRELEMLTSNAQSNLSSLTNRNPKDVENRNIIEGIINAITYGFVSIRKSLLENNSIRDYVINFKVEGFELNITVEKFLELFREHNLEIVNKHFEKKEKTKKKVRK